MKTIRIATRKSELALWQAKHVGSLISQSDSELDVEIVGYTTEGDIRRHERLQDLGGKGLFTQELERGLLEQQVDFAVHSMKDVPANLDELFGVVAAGERADVRDALVGADSILALPKGSRVGSSSGRRSAQLVRQNRDLDIVPVRGNVGTRLEKLRRGEFDALLLACAGLDRLGLSSEVGQR
nr:hydroxymethylbilane synthase [Pseudomonadales bacterium]